MGPTSLPQGASPNPVNPAGSSNTTMTNDTHHHHNNNHDQKYNNQREINALPYQMA
jgi:hypothetical protein